MYITNRILINEKFKFFVIGGLSANTFFLVKIGIKIEQLNYSIVSFNRDVVYI